VSPILYLNLDPWDLGTLLHQASESFSMEKAKLPRKKDVRIGHPWLLQLQHKPE
jgi:hypothetical protein